MGAGAPALPMTLVLRRVDQPRRMGDPTHKENTPLWREIQQPPGYTEVPLHTLDVRLTLNRLGSKEY